jgi:hypothetical protein
MECEECGAGQHPVELTRTGYQTSLRDGALRVQLHRPWCSQHGQPGTATLLERAEDTKPDTAFQFDELELDDEGFPF